MKRTKNDLASLLMASHTARHRHRWMCRQRSAIASTTAGLGYDTSVSKHFFKMNSKTIKGLCLTTVMSLCSCDYGYNYYIQNCTKDTIVIGVSSCERIDSVYRIMQGSGTVFDIKKFSNDTIRIYEWNQVFPDSVAEDGSVNCPLFYHNKNNCGYLFIIKWETAKSHTWEEICRRELYDTLVIVTREMVKDGNGIGYCGVGKPIKTTNKVWQ